ncbi:MAG: restriction endonuclease subunit S [Acidimicrobiales bacterium]
MALGELLRSAAVFADGDWVETKDQDPEGDVRLTQLADVGVGEWRDRSFRFMKLSRAKEMGCTFLEPGDVLVARMPEPLGRACIFPGDARQCVTAVDVCILRPDDEVTDGRWLMWMLNSPECRAQIAARQSGTTRKRISRRNLAEIELSLPPRREQTRIVAAIEEQFSRLVVAEQLLERARRRGVLVRSATLTAVTHPAAAHWTTLGEIADIVGGVTKDSKRQQDESLVEVPYLRVANVQRGYLDLREVTMIRVPPEKVKVLRLEPGDILFNEGGDRDKLGRGWIWSGEIDDCIHQNHVFRARLTVREFEPKFVSMHGNTFGRQWFEQMGKQTTNLASINLKTLKSFPVPMIPVEEQRTRVAVAELRLSVLDSLITSMDRAIALSGRLRRSILNRAFSGALVPQDPADQSASELPVGIARQVVLHAGEGHR